MGFLGGSDKQKQETSQTQSQQIQRQGLLDFSLASPFLGLSVNTPVGGPTTITNTLGGGLDESQLALQQQNALFGSQLQGLANTLFSPNNEFLNAVTQPLVDQRDRALADIGRSFGRRNVFGSLSAGAQEAQRRLFNDQITNQRLQAQQALTTQGLQAAQQAGVLTNNAANILAQRINREMSLQNLGLQALRQAQANQLTTGTTSQLEGVTKTKTSTNPGILGALGGIADIAGAGFGLSGSGIFGGSPSIPLIPTSSPNIPGLFHQNSLNFDGATL